MEKVRVLVWNEFLHEKEDEKVRKVYPDGIHEAIAEGLRKCDNFEVKTATLDMPEFGLDDETLDNTDVLVFVSWFAGGEVFRSGACPKRGLGKIFYFRPGHETYPTYYKRRRKTGTD